MVQTILKCYIIDHKEVHKNGVIFKMFTVELFLPCSYTTVLNYVCVWTYTHVCNGPLYSNENEQIIVALNYVNTFQKVKEENCSRPYGMGF